jgi:hypothetical protein
MKPAIAYGILGSHYGDNWEILSITSETSGRRGRVNGRDGHGNPTHATPDDVRGRFETIEEATTALEAIQRLHAQHAPGIAAAATAYSKLQNDRNEAIRHALENIRVAKISYHPESGFLKRPSAG